jgi:hypothetical protein
MARFDFKRRQRRGSTEPQRLGLVVPRRALRQEENGGVDELAVIEDDYRRNGNPPVIFEDSDADDVPVW